MVWLKAWTWPQCQPVVEPERQIDEPTGATLEPETTRAEPLYMSTHGRSVSPEPVRTKASVVAGNDEPAKVPLGDDVEVLVARQLAGGHEAALHGESDRATTAITHVVGVAADDVHEGVGLFGGLHDLDVVTVDPGRRHELLGLRGRAGRGGDDHRVVLDVDVPAGDRFGRCFPCGRAGPPPC